MSAQSLERALAGLGVADPVVEARDTLAVLTLRDAASLADPRVRDAVVQLALEHGFTHLALELVGDVAPDAPVHRA